MHQLVNNTQFSASKAAQVDCDGYQIWVVVVKCTYDIAPDGSLALACEQELVHTHPLFLGDPSKSSLLRDAEIVSSHPGTDVSVVAYAYAPHGTEATQVEIGCRVGDLSTEILVTGDRFWERRLGGLRITPPARFRKLPVIYERAYGGVSEHDGTRHIWRSNPAGRGYIVNPSAADGVPLPNLENRTQLIRGWNGQPEPVGLLPIPGHWPQRLQYAGTYDDRWKRERMPLLPRDYDHRFALSAHPTLISKDCLRGGEVCSFTNMTPSGNLAFALPRASLSVMTHTKTGILRQSIQLDRVIIQLEKSQLMMVWRSSLNCKARVRDIVYSVIDLLPKRSLAELV